jgi:competence protein ComEA
VIAVRSLAAGALLLWASPGLAEKKPLSPGERIDLNRAGVEELMRIPGVGKRRAQAIVEYRARQPFRSPEEVTRVKGLGADWYARVRQHLSAGAAPRPGQPAPARAAPGTTPGP